MRIVLTVPTLVVVALLLTVTPRAFAEPTRAFTDPVDATFPVDDPDGLTSFIDDYDHPRGGGTRTHRATDIGGVDAAGLGIHAAMGGTITWITGLDGADPHRSAGYAVRIAGDDGRAYTYIHLGPADGPVEEAYAPGIDRGVRVERGQLLGYLGWSGNASESWPHLHLEIEDPAVTDPEGGHRVNPYATLVAALERGDLPHQVTPMGRFLDVRATDRHAGAIDAVAEAGITRGCEPLRYCPTGTVTRGQMATFLANAFQLEVPEEPARFTDVPDEHVHHDGIAAVAAADVANGLPDGRFAPGHLVRRDQMATFLANALELEPVAPDFDDVHPETTHATAIGAVAEAGITVGAGERLYGPDGTVTRAQMASFLQRALQLEPADG